VGPAKRYRIELRGRLSDAILAPYADEFLIDRTDGTTTLAGDVRDAAHLHGIVSHLTGLGVELVSANTVEDGDRGGLPSPEL